MNNAKTRIHSSGRHSIYQDRENHSVQAKKALSLASLVAAIPAGVLIYFLVTVILKSSENISGMMMGILAITMLSCAALLFIPVAAIVFGGRKLAPHEAAIVADATETPAGSKKTGKASDETFDGELEEPAATFADQTIELDEDAMIADEDLDDFETFDDLDDDRK